MQLHTTGENIVALSISAGMMFVFWVTGENKAAIMMLSMLVGWFGYEAFKYFVKGR